MNDEVRAIGHVTGDHGAPLFIGVYRGRVNVAGVMLDRHQLAALRGLLDRAEREAGMAEPAADVTHDPRTDWCACEPEGADRCGYRMLADKVIERFNPPDGDEAEVALLMLALDVAADYITDQPCACDREPDLPCFRCSALGQRSRERVQR